MADRRPPEMRLTPRSRTRRGPNVLRSGAPIRGQGATGHGTWRLPRTSRADAGERSRDARRSVPAKRTPASRASEWSARQGLRAAMLEPRTSPATAVRTGPRNTVPVDGVTSASEEDPAEGDAMTRREGRQPRPPGDRRQGPAGRSRRRRGSAARSLAVRRRAPRRHDRPIRARRRSTRRADERRPSSTYWPDPVATAPRAQVVPDWSSETP